MLTQLPAGKEGAEQSDPTCARILACTDAPAPHTRHREKREKEGSRSDNNVPPNTPDNEPYGRDTTHTLSKEVSVGRTGGGLKQSETVDLHFEGLKSTCLSDV